MAGVEPRDAVMALSAWRATTLESLIRWNLACSALSLIVLAWTIGLPAYRPLLLAGWALVGILGVLALGRRLPWRVRAVAFLAVNYGVVTIASAWPSPTSVAFAQAVALVALSGLLLGGRAATGAATLAFATLALRGVAGAGGWVESAPQLARGLVWLAALAGTAPAIVLVVLALRRVVDQQRDALQTATGALRDLAATRAHLADSERAELAGRLAGALAHDLNNTLTVVVASAEWLKEHLAGREEVEAASEICEAANNASSLTQQVLLASRSGMSQPRVLDLTRTITLAAGALRRLLPPDIRVETRVDGAVWTVFDPGQIQQILLSLALTARAAMPGGGTLGLAVRPGGAAPSTPGEPPPAAILEVSDTGFGMDAEERRRAFEPSQDGARPGRGVGLNGVKTLVEAGGGQALLRSWPGTGTVVTITLPGSLPPGPEAAAPAPVRPARVLVVEDDIRVRAVVCTALAEAGHEVNEVSDGTLAMRAIEELGAVDLLVTDVVMPGVPIAEVLATYRARHPGGKILVCSAFSDDEGLRQRVHAGEYRLLPKPFTRNELLAEVQGLLADTLSRERAAGAQGAGPRTSASA